jgi:hypothetical protein
VVLIINKGKIASVTSDNRPLGDIMDDVMAFLSPGERVTSHDAHDIICLVVVYPAHVRKDLT